MRRQYAILWFCIFTGSNFCAFAESLNEDTLKTIPPRQRKWYLPHYVPVQYAGNIGLISCGIGYTARKDNYQLSLVYGYVPESVAGVNIHAITAKNTFHVYRFFLSEKQSLIPYASCALSLEVGGRSFFSLPSAMPEGYYNFPKSLHLIPGAGLKLRYVQETNFLRGMEFFAETTTVDVYVWSKFISDEIRLHHIFSVAFGVNLLMK